MRLEDFSRRVDQLIEQADTVINTRFTADSFGTQYVDPGAMAGLRGASLSFLSSVFGDKHALVRTLESTANRTALASAKAAREILIAAKTEMEGGWTMKVRGLVAAEFFSDFLEMGEYLLSEGYKDAAAVIIGSVLEEHLRELCRGAGIATEIERDGRPVAKKADLLNSELASAGRYGKLDQKTVTTSLDLRNKAAHGLYSEYSRSQVDLMYQSVTDFLARNPV
jgi:hypothetical protein